MKNLLLAVALILLYHYAARGQFAAINDTILLNAVYFDTPTKSIHYNGFLLNDMGNNLQVDTIWSNTNALTIYPPTYFLTFIYRQF